MLDFIIKAALQNRMLTIAVALLGCFYGLLTTQQLSIDVFPDLNRPTVHIVTELEGMAPEEVEIAASKPLELAINGLPGLLKVHSTSATGISVIRAEFDWDIDLKDARIAVGERLSTVRGKLPLDAEPYLTPTSSIMGEIQMIGLTSKDKTLSPLELRTLASWNIRPRLMAIAGVAQVTVLGGEEEEIQVLIDPKALQSRLISPKELAEKLQSISMATGGGFVSDEKNEWLIRNIGRISSFEDLGQTPIGVHLGRAVILKDVAEIRRGAGTKRGDASVNGEAGVIMMVQKQNTADTLKVTQAVDAALEEMTKSLPAGASLKSDLFRQADFIKISIDNVIEALRDGTLIVAIILFLFLLNLRPTLITLTAIPLSLLFSAIIFHFMGIGINTMTLGGLAIAIGELVDDAIVDVENVYRRLRENAESETPLPPLKVVYMASSEIRNSIALATLVVVLVFLPLFFLPGLEGRLFTPIGTAYVISILASLLVSLTATPVLCYYLLGKTNIKHARDGFVVRILKAIDRKILEIILPHPYAVLGVISIFVAAALSAIPHMGRDFLPPFNEGGAMAEVSMKAGISLEASSELAMTIEKSLLSIPEVVSTGRRTGRADEDDHAAGVNQTEWEIALRKSARSRSEVFEDIRSKLKENLPKDAYFSITQPISHRLDHLLSGVKAQVAIKIFGPDLRILRQQGAEIRNAIEGTPGVVDLKLEGQSLFPQHKIYPMRSDLAQYGLSPGEIVESLELLLQGVAITRITENDRILNVTVRLEEAFRKTIDDIKKITLHVLPSGQAIKVEEVSDVYETSGPNVIAREGMSRRIAISFNTSGRDIEGTVEDVKARIAKAVSLPEGYSLSFDGQYESQKIAMQKVFLLGALSLIAIFLVLAIHFRSALLSVQILLNVPLALIGAVIGVYLTGKTFSVATLIAFITHCGIASRNGIMMISHYIHLMKEEGESFTKEMIIRGSLERLVPVLMTASTAMLALTPLLFAKGEPGKEILHPVAVVIVSGLFTSTLLDIFVTPTVFWKFGRKAAERAAQHTSEDIL